MLVLPVEIDEPFAELLELRDRGGPASDPRSGLSTRGDFARYEQLRIFRLVAHLFEQRAYMRRVRDVEDGVDRCSRRAASHHLRAGPAAQNGVERVDNDRFACASFAREDDETASEVDLNLIDDREVTDREGGEHRRSGDGRFADSAAACAKARIMVYECMRFQRNCTVAHPLCQGDEWAGEV
jgi:hypothetical protein